MINLREIIQDLFYEKTRAILTIIAVSFGTFSIVVTLAVGEGLRLNFSRVMKDAGDKLLEINSGIASKNYFGIRANESLQLIKKDVAAIKMLPNVANISLQYEFHSKIRYRDFVQYASFRAVAPEYAAIHNLKVGPRQRFFSFLDMQKKSPVVVIGSETAAKIFAPEENPIGKIIYIDDYPFTVIGVMQKKAEMFVKGGGMPDSWFNWISATVYELRRNPQKVDTIAISYKDFAQLSQTKSAIQKVVVLNHGADPSDISIINFVDMAKAHARVNKFFINMQIFLGVIGGLTLFLAGVGIANVTYAAVKRQTRQIGVKMALGATKKHILLCYISESLVATAIGGTIGVLNAIIFIHLIRLIPLNSMMVRIFGKPEPTLSFLVLLIVILVLGAMGLIAGLLPALKATKIDPAEALIYE